LKRLKTTFIFWVQKNKNNKRELNNRIKETKNLRSKLRSKFKEGVIKE
jgi:hypothetical protein